MEIFIIVIIIVILIILIALVTVGQFLVSVDHKEASDAIIVLSGAEGRLEKGIELFAEGYGEHIMLSNSVDFDEDTLHKNDIPKERVIQEPKADSTFTNAIYTKEIMLDRELTSALIVTSEFHTSRTKYIFNKVFEDTEIRLNFIGSKNSFFGRKFWWLNLKGIYIVTVECVKWLYYLVRY